MSCKAAILCAVCVALISSCRSVVNLSSDGSLADRAVICIAPEGQPENSQAFAAREGCMGQVRLSVPASQARAPHIATLVPDFHRSDNEKQLRFIPADTKALIFSKEGITRTPRRRN